MLLWAIAVVSSPPIWWEITADILTITGTLFLAILAIWGPLIRSWCAGPRLKIEPTNTRGTRVKRNNGQWVIYYHMTVVNERHWAPAHTCRVLIVKVERRGPDDQFYEVPLSAPPWLEWTPSNIAPPAVTIVKEQRFDLAYLNADGQQVCPAVRWMTNDFDGFVKPNQVLRFHLQVECDEYVTKTGIVEIAWDGQWSDSVEDMQPHLRIKLLRRI